MRIFCQIIARRTFSIFKLKFAKEINFDHMAIKMSFKLLLISLIVFIYSVIVQIESKDVHYEFTVSYFTKYPDGVRKQVLGVNKQFPGPTIYATKGDRLIIKVSNRIQDKQGTTIHWHGIFQKGTPFEDGPEHITQCPIPYGKSQTYVFVLRQGGTYWWHAHVSGQYTDGLWGALIIHDVPEPYRKDYDDEIVITLSDWYHHTAQEGTSWFLSPASEGNEPSPDSCLINGRGYYPCDVAREDYKTCLTFFQKKRVFKLNHGKRYRFRVINTSAFASFNFSIDEHQMKVIEADGVPTKKVPVDVFVIAPAQRYSFILSMNPNCKRKFWIRVGVQSDMFPPGVNNNLHPEALLTDMRAILEYSNCNPWPSYSKTIVPKYPTSIPHDPKLALQLNEDDLTPFDLYFSPRFDEEKILYVVNTVDEANITRLLFNNILFSPPANRPPLLSLVIKNESLPELYNPIHCSFGKVIQIVLNNLDGGGHPFHLHGHTFWVLGRGAEDDGNYTSSNPNHTLILDGVVRDTVVVEAHSWVVIRFRADNPGHINWHLQGGLGLTIIVRPENIHNLLYVPQETRRICSLNGVSIT